MRLFTLLLATSILLAQPLSLCSARLPQQHILQQQQLRTNPDGEDNWNVRPIVGILTQVYTKSQISAKVLVAATTYSYCWVSLPRLGLMKTSLYQVGTTRIPSSSSAHACSIDDQALNGWSFLLQRMGRT